MLERLGGDFLQWLRGFYYVMTLGSISAAAQHMGLRQPTVSHQIQMLEGELGVQLFQRAPRRMIPTREGVALYERAIGVFEQIRGIKTEIGREQEGRVKGEICLVTTHSVASNYLPPLIQGFSEANPETFFTITGATEASFIINKVVSSSIEMGIVLGQGFPPSICAQPLFSSPLALIVGKKQAKAKGWIFSRDSNGNLERLDELSGVPYVGFAPDAGLTHYLHNLLASHNVEIVSTVTVNTSTLVVRYVEQGFGVSIIDSFTALAAPEGCFDIYPLRSVFHARPYHLITREKSYLSPQALAFIQYLRRENNQIPGTLPAGGGGAATRPGPARASRP